MATRSLMVWRICSVGAPASTTAIAPNNSTILSKPPTARSFRRDCIAISYESVSPIPPAFRTFLRACLNPCYQHLPGKNKLKQVSIEKGRKRWQCGDGASFATTARQVELHERHGRKWALRFAMRGIDGRSGKNVH